MSKSDNIPPETRVSSEGCLVYTVAESGVAFIAIDVPGRKVNVLTRELHREIGAVAERLAQDEAAIGAVLYSGKPTFMAGGDLNRIVQYYDLNRSPEEAYSESRLFTESLRKLETCGKPVAAVINGTALGGGLELTLACHYRVVADDEKILLGLPEVNLGLLPGAGGTQRLPRLIGLKEAASLILSGQPVSPAQALELGFVDQLAAPDQLLAEAEKWVLEKGQNEQPWDRKGYRIPGGSKLNDVNIGRLFQTLTAEVAAKHQYNYPAPIAALRCLFNGTSVNSIDAGLQIETREFSALTRDPVARNIIRTLFINKRLRKFGKDQCDEKMIEFCQQAYRAEAAYMVSEGVSPALIENAARAAGMSEGPLTQAGINMAETVNQHPARATAVNIEPLKLRLLSIQSLAALHFQDDQLSDPVAADLNSIIGWGFPAWTGGVMSYIDTMGWRAFIGQCDRLAADHGERFKVNEALRSRAEKNDRIYPAQA